MLLAFSAIYKHAYQVYLPKEEKASWDEAKVGTCRSSKLGKFHIVIKNGFI